MAGKKKNTNPQPTPYAPARPRQTLGIHQTPAYASRGLRQTIPPSYGVAPRRGFGGLQPPSTVAGPRHTRRAWGIQQQQPPSAPYNVYPFHGQPYPHPHFGFQPHAMPGYNPSFGFDGSMGFHPSRGQPTGQPIYVYNGPDASNHPATFDRPTTFDSSQIQSSTVPASDVPPAPKSPAAKQLTPPVVCSSLALGSTLPPESRHSKVITENSTNGSVSTKQENETIHAAPEPESDHPKPQVSSNISDSSQGQDVAWSSQIDEVDFALKRAKNRSYSFTEAPKEVWSESTLSSGAPTEFENAPSEIAMDKKILEQKDTELENAQSEIAKYKGILEQKEILLVQANTMVKKATERIKTLEKDKLESEKARTGPGKPWPDSIAYKQALEKIETEKRKVRIELDKLLVEAARSEEARTDLGDAWSDVSTYKEALDKIQSENRKLRIDLDKALAEGAKSKEALEASESLRKELLENYGRMVAKLTEDHAEDQAWNRKLKEASDMAEMTIEVFEKQAKAWQLKAKKSRKIADMYKERLQQHQCPSSEQKLPLGGEQDQLPPEQVQPRSVKGDRLISSQEDREKEIKDLEDAMANLVSVD